MGESYFDPYLIMDIKVKEVKAIKLMGENLHDLGLGKDLSVIPKAKIH